MTDLATIDRSICFRHTAMKEQIEGRLVCRVCYDLAINCVIWLRISAIGRRLGEIDAELWFAERNQLNDQIQALITEQVSLNRKRRELEKIRRTDR